MITSGLERAAPPYLSIRYPDWAAEQALSPMRLAGIRIAEK